MNAWTVTKKLWQIYRPFRLTILAVLVVIAVNQLVGLAGPYLFGRLTDALYAKAGFNVALKIAGEMLVLGLISILLELLQDRIELRQLDFEIPNFISRFSVRKFLGFSIGQHLNHNSGVSQKIMDEGSGSARDMMNVAVFQALPTLAHIVVMTVALCLFDYRMGLILLSGIIVFSFVFLLMNSRFAPKLRKIVDLSMKRGRLQNDIYRNPVLIISNAREDKTMAEYEAEQNDVVSFAVPAWIRYVAQWAGGSIILEVTEFSILVLGIYYVLQGQYTIGSLVMIWSWASNALGRARNIGFVQRNLLRSYASVKKYLEMIEANPSRTETLADSIQKPVRGQIKADVQSFQYPVRQSSDEEEDEKPLEPGKIILRDVKLSIKPGQKVALVGKTGSGKSTLANIIMGAFDEGLEGDVFIDGHDMRQWNRKFLLRSIGHVAQEVKIFDNTLRHNLLYSLDNEDVSDAELDKVMAQVNLLDFVRGLEKGYDTPTGENGAKLSGGQKQRLGIARALIKKPAVLILDEPTNNLDAENEAAVQEAIDRAADTATTIIIAHRLSTIVDCDQVIVLDEGHIVGQGDHASLYESCTLYRELVDTQITRMMKLAALVGFKNDSKSSGTTEPSTLNRL
ncbi:MAG TPA: ABC transporter ATP-binding protein [Candidatus Paceibacterota bacterium]|nr:ABC transporter ATP-binding protein [Candidatus Paceibacterota bacterium]